MPSPAGLKYVAGASSVALTEIIELLGLKSTGLGSRGSLLERLVRTTTPEFQPAEFGWNGQFWQEFGSPAGGMLSTPEDFAMICALMLGDGQWNGARPLSPATVWQMTTNRLDDLPDLPEPVRSTHP